MPVTPYARPGLQGVRLALVALGLSAFTTLVIQFTKLNSLFVFTSLVVGGVTAILIVRNPYIGVLLLLAIFLIDVDPVGIKYLGLPYLLSTVLAIPLTLSILRDRTIWVWHVPQIRILLLIGLLFLISAAANYSTTSFASGSVTTRMLIIFFSRLFFMVLFLYYISTRERIELTAWVVLAVIIFISIEALYGFLAKHGDPTQGGLSLRARASFSLAENANRLAFICLFAASFIWFQYSYGKAYWWRPLVFPFFFLLPLTTFTTGSRSGFLQGVALVALILKEQKGWTIRKRVRTFVLVGLAGFIAISLVPAHNLERATNFNPTRQTAGKASLQNRIITDYAALKIALSHPFLGVGLGNFRWVKLETEGLGRAAPTHNGYLWALTSGGVGVFTLYLILFFQTYRLIRRLEDSGPRELLWLSKGLKVNLFLFLIFSLSTDFWLSDFLYLLIGLPIAMTICWQREHFLLEQRRLAAKRALEESRAAGQQQPYFPQMPSAAPARSF